MKECHEKAYAKINIGLNIVGRRSDGYHEIETIFQQIDLCDEVVVESMADKRIEIWSNHDRVPRGKANLCYRAVELVRQASGDCRGVRIRLYKRIPIAAGLGGGSSDAAAVLKCLTQLWQLDFSMAQLHRLAASLGADVPFFLYGGTAFASGIGDKILPIGLPFNFSCVLVYPNIEISSRWAFNKYNLSLTKTKKCIKLSRIFLNGLAIHDLKKIILNDLEEVVFQRYPLLGEIKQALYDSGAFYASMSGSGSTIYGMFQNRGDAVEVEKSHFLPYPIIFAMPKITSSHL